MNKAGLLLILGALLVVVGVVVGLAPIRADGITCGSFLGGGANFVLNDECGRLKDDQSALFFLSFLPGVAMLAFVGLDLVKMRRQQKPPRPIREDESGALA